MLAWTTQSSSNPLIPNQWEFTVLGIGMLALFLFVVALIDIARSRHLTGLARAVWVLVVLALPLVGPLLWLVIGRLGNATTRVAKKSPASSAR
ncbi:hypothetical protein GCM10009784_15470 [Arthrobacter parietis]|uniref:PLDc N-terminal domain-containing protein n=2 Tax=Arthrobacter TaxID=1663 RepID=A0ABT6CYB5_9MICC|nr:PLDc N-terminal domain-containing protein [Arthrobacter vasquezii]MDF9278595.1 PLDc N-terminal domain-containing protein [Arthrobacter vasquezii]